MPETIIDNNVVIIRKLIRIHKPSDNKIVLAWRSSQVADVIGDCIGYLLYQISNYPEFENS